MIEVKYYRLMKNVDRMSRWPKLRGYNLLEHSYMVTVLFMRFAKLENVEYDVEVLDFILHHDVLEAITGDLGHDVKKMNFLTEDCWNAIENTVVERYPQFEKYTDVRADLLLTVDQHQLFKVCDLLDLWIFLNEEKALGNTSMHISDMIDTCISLVRDKFDSVTSYMNNFKF